MSLTQGTSCASRSVSVRGGRVLVTARTGGVDRSTLPSRDNCVVLLTEHVRTAGAVTSTSYTIPTTALTSTDGDVLRLFSYAWAPRTFWPEHDSLYACLVSVSPTDFVTAVRRAEASRLAVQLYDALVNMRKRAVRVPDGVQVDADFAVRVIEWTVFLDAPTQ